MRRGWWLLLAAVGCGSENEILPTFAEITVGPPTVDFGEVVVDEETRIQPLRIGNSGNRVLEGTIEIAGDGADQYAVSVEQFSVGIDQELALDLTYTPTALGPAPATVVFVSNDPDLPFTVDVTGVGRVPYAADLVIDPDTLRWDAPGLRNLLLRNVGDADLHLGTITQSGAGSFEVLPDWSGTTVAPGESRPVQVRWTGAPDAAESGTLTVPSVDAAGAVLETEEAAFESNGGGPSQYPEAVIDCPGELPLPGPVDVVLDGSDSEDPGGLDLTYAWTITRRPDAADPAGVPHPADAPITTVRVDAAGTWEVALVVTNVDGLSSVPTKCVLDAVPEDALHVELSWGGLTADLDLHLAESPDVGFYEVPGDVSYCNPNPGWGAGGADDDPSLDLDDSDGLGPENVNVLAPADGTYPVRVHVFDDGVDGEVSATVSVFTYGELAYSASKVLARNEVWDVGEVNWPDGTFAESTARPWDAEGVRECHE